MTKSELIDSIAQISGFTKKDAGKALDAVIEAIKQSLMRGEKVQVWVLEPSRCGRGLNASGVTPEQKLRL